MIEMVLVYCLISDPAKCIEERPRFEDELTPAACLMTAQQVALEYVKEHPQYQFSRWRCEAGKPKSEPT